MSPSNTKSKQREAQAAPSPSSRERGRPVAHVSAYPVLEPVCSLKFVSFISQAFLVADALKTSAGKFPKKSSPSHSQGWLAIGGWNPCPVPLGLTEVHAFPVELPKAVSKKCRFGCLTQTLRQVLVQKENGFIQVLRFGRIVDCLKGHLPFLLKLHILKRSGGEGFLKTSSYLASFWSD